MDSWGLAVAVVTAAVTVVGAVVAGAWAVSRSIGLLEARMGEVDRRLMELSATVSQDSRDMWARVEDLRAKQAKLDSRLGLIEQVCRSQHGSLLPPVLP